MEFVASLAWARWWLQPGRSAQHRRRRPFLLLRSELTAEVLARARLRLGLWRSLLAKIIGVRSRLPKLIGTGCDPRFEIRPTAPFPDRAGRVSLGAASVDRQRV